MASNGGEVMVTKQENMTTTTQMGEVENKEVATHQESPSHTEVGEVIDESFQWIEMKDIIVSREENGNTMAQGEKYDKNTHTTRCRGRSMSRTPTRSWGRSMTRTSTTGRGRSMSRTTT